MHTKVLGFHIQQLTMQTQELTGGQPFLKAEMLRQEADPRQRRAVADGFPQQGRRAGGGCGQPQQHFDRGRFAGAVGAQEAKHLTLQDLQGEAFDCGGIAEDFS
jgi:hypothetical protein